MTDGWGISCKIAFRWMPMDLTDDKSRLVQVMAWCPQATSHYLSQCWPSSMSPYGITRPEWVNINILTYGYRNSVRWSNDNLILLNANRGMAKSLWLPLSTFQSLINNCNTKLYIMLGTHQVSVNSVRVTISHKVNNLQHTGMKVNCVIMIFLWMSIFFSQ